VKRLLPVSTSRFSDPDSARLLTAAFIRLQRCNATTSSLFIEKIHYDGSMTMTVPVRGSIVDVPVGRGLVRFYAIPFSSGKWVRIELSEPAGKDGTVQGANYFTCKHGWGVSWPMVLFEGPGHTGGIATLNNATYPAFPPHVGRYINREKIMK